MLLMHLTRNLASKSNWPVERPRITFLLQTCANNQNGIFCSPLLQQVPGSQQPASKPASQWWPLHVYVACVCSIRMYIYIYTIYSSFHTCLAVAISMSAVDMLSHTNPHNICSIQHSTYASVALPPLLLTIYNIMVWYT